jgi:hypothetical protein
VEEAVVVMDGLEAMIDQTTLHLLTLRSHRESVKARPINQDSRELPVKRGGRVSGPVSLVEEQLAM